VLRAIQLSKHGFTRNGVRPFNVRRSQNKLYTIHGPRIVQSPQSELCKRQRRPQNNGMRRAFHFQVIRIMTLPGDKSGIFFTANGSTNSKLRCSNLIHENLKNLESDPTPHLPIQLFTYQQRTYSGFLNLQVFSGAPQRCCFQSNLTSLTHHLEQNAERYL